MSPEEQAFLAEYMSNGFDGTAAMGSIFPTLAPQNRHVYAWRWLRRCEIRDEVDRQLAERRASSKLTIGKIEGMLLDIAEVEPLDIFDEYGGIRPLGEIAPNARRAIKSIRKKEHPITGIVDLEIELWDKKGAIELLGKYKKMFTDKVEHSGELKQKVSVTINGIRK